MTVDVQRLERHRASVGLPHAVLTGLYVVTVLLLHARSTFLVNSFEKFSDWSDYQAVARESVLSGGFWSGSKPMGYPLLVKVLGEGSALHWGAVAISTAAWVVLSIAVAALLGTRWVSVLACALILSFSLAQRVQVWNDLAGSETLSISLFVLALAAGCVLVNPQLGRLRVAAWIVLALSLSWWCFTRDSNVYVLLLSAIVGVVFAAVRRSSGAALMCAAALVVSFVALVASDGGDRWVVPYYNVVFNRVLPDQDLAAAWRDAGMPDARALRHHIGEIAYGGDPALFHGRDLAAFRRWVRQDGRQTYVENLITRPALSVRGPVSDFDDLLTSPVEVWGRIGGHSYAGSPLDPVFNSVFVPDATLLVIWLALVVAAGVWLLLRATNRAAAALAIVVFALGFPHLWLVWVGDAHNIARHAVTASVQIRLAGWIILLLALDEYRRPRPTPQAQRLPARDTEHHRAAAPQPPPPSQSLR